MLQTAFFYCLVLTMQPLAFNPKPSFKKKKKCHTDATIELDTQNVLRISLMLCISCSAILSALPFLPHTYFNLGGTHFQHVGWWQCQHGLLSALWGLPLCPWLLQAGGIITEAAIHIPLGCELQYMGLEVSAEKWDARRQTKSQIGGSTETL